MLEKQVIINKVVDYVNTQLSTLTSSNPILMLARPFVSRAMNTYIGKLDKFLTAIQDEKGMIDIEGILDEEIDNLLVMQLHKTDNFSIGEGKVKFTIPVINKEIVIDTNDIAEFKQSLINSKQ